MDQDNAHSRRRVLRTTAVTMTASTAVVAGCADQGEESEDEPEAEEGTGNGQEREGEEPEEAQDDEDVSHEESGDLSEDEDEGGDQEEQEVDDAESWADVDEILLATDEDVWIGQKPSLIEDEENPTLELTADQEYEIGYENRDGDGHSLAIWAEDEERQGTDVEQSEGEQQWLTVEATDDLTAYRCEVHSDTMAGEIEITSE